MARAVGDIAQQWVADTQLTIGLATGPLASDPNLLAGRESSAFVFSTLDNVLDALISGKITTGTSPTVNKSIEVWVAGPIEDTPAWGDVLDGTDSNETITSTNVKNAYLKNVTIITVDATSDRTYPFGPFALAGLFGGRLPKQIVVFVVHNTGVALNGTAGNHEISIAPIYDNAKLS